MIEDDLLDAIIALIHGEIPAALDGRLARLASGGDAPAYIEHHRREVHDVRALRAETRRLTAVARPHAIGPVLPFEVCSSAESGSTFPTCSTTYR